MLKQRAGLVLGLLAGAYPAFILARTRVQRLFEGNALRDARGNRFLPSSEVSSKMGWGERNGRSEVNFKISRFALILKFTLRGPWSSYRTLLEQDTPTFLSRDVVLKKFGGREAFISAHLNYNEAFWDKLTVE